MMIAAIIIVSILSMLLGAAGCIVFLLIAVGSSEHSDHKKYHVPNTISYYKHNIPHDDSFYNAMIQALKHDIVEHDNRIKALEIDVYSLSNQLKDIVKAEDCDDGK